MANNLKAYEVTVSHPCKPFTKAKKDTYFRAAKSKAQIIADSWLSPKNSTGVFYGIYIKIRDNMSIDGLTSPADNDF